MTEAATGSLVVVGALADAGRHDTRAGDRHDERRGLDRRVHDQAVSAAYDATTLPCAAQALLYGLEVTSLGTAAPLSADPLSLGWLAAATLCWSFWLLLPLLFRYACHGHGDTRRWRHLLDAAVLLNLATAAAFVWLPSVQPLPAGQALGLGGLLGCSLLIALCLPMLALPAVMACAITALDAVARLAPSPAAWHGPLLACAALATLGGWIARGRQRDWLSQTRSVHACREQLARLRADHDRAVRAEQDKSRFIATASHDLRQPMHALGLFVATLEQRLQGRPEAPLVRNMMCSVESLDRSFTAVLDISRIDAGALTPHPQCFALRDLFLRLHLHFAGQAEENGLTLRLSPGGKQVCSDPQLLERILGNLVQNAIKYTRRGGIVVVARTTRSHLNIEVWDSGVGIPADELPHIFDEFYQVGSHRRDSSGGLGMGLAIVKRLVQLLGHTLSVSSRPGHGSRFRIGIPVTDPELDDASVPADTVPVPMFQARTVLVIDDEAPIRNGLCLLLEEWGFDAYAAADVAEARQVTAQLDGQIDLMLCDLHLAGREDGLQVIEQVRLLSRRPVPAVLITGDTSPAEIRRASASGNSVLFKPVQPRQLMAALRNVAP